ncbi:MAG: aspartate aminotransferase family protein [Acidaminococcales bacterium]|jgi:4-aminobutyrate aminotransferase|nr:aspartate aminotransferase family protein [Acidaminococcales bacterium]
MAAFDFAREGDVNEGGLRKEWRQALDGETDALLREDEAVFLKQSMSTPCLNVIADARGCYIFDLSGKRYLDFHGNGLHQVGYKNERVIRAVTEQMARLPFIPRRYTAEIAVRAAEKLIDKTTGKDFRVLFTPSGTAAVGIALKIARKVTGRHKVISLWESFHGASLDCISAGGEYIFKKDMGPMLSGNIRAMPYNAYRNLINSEDPEKVAAFCLAHMEYIIENEGEIGALLLEPIRATDIHIPPQSYFAGLRALCDKHGMLLVFDEIPTAPGRSGHFYVHQRFAVEPDIAVLGKGLGGGVVPQAAVLAKKHCDIAQDISLGHYTHEKPALGCAAALAAIEYIDAEKLLAKCAALSAFAQDKAAKLAEKYACVGDVRIAGLLIAFELVKDRKSKEKAIGLAEKVLYYCLERGLSFKLSAGNCITWHPPLIVTEKELAFAFALLEDALKACAPNSSV